MAATLALARALAVAVAVAVVGAGCSWTIEDDGGWLPLVGTAPSLAAAPQIMTPSFTAGSGVRGADGRIWILDHDQESLSLQALDGTGTLKTYPQPAAFVTDAVLASSPVDGNPESETFRLTLDRLGAAPDVARDITLAQPALTIEARRGPGFFAFHDPDGPTPDAPRFVHLLFDDGREEQIPVGDAHWQLLGAEGGTTVGLGGDAGVLGSADYLLLLGLRDGAQPLAVYEVRTHELHELFDLPPQLNPGGADGPNWSEAPELVYDAARERLWICGAKTLSVALATREVRDFGFGCIYLRMQAGQELIAQDARGQLYALAPDGSGAEPFAKVDPFRLRAVRGRSFVYTRRGADQYHGGAYDGWIGDVQVIHAGLAADFSADGKMLRWLENASGGGGDGVGDLYARELATGTVRHLARNVMQFAELPDGRVVAIADAANEGAWNRAIVIDEAKGEARWIARGVQLLQVIGDQVVLASRSSGGLTKVYLAPLPPR